MAEAGGGQSDLVKPARSESADQQDNKPYWEPRGYEPLRGVSTFQLNLHLGVLVEGNAAPHTSESLALREEMTKLAQEDPLKFAKYVSDKAQRELEDLRLSQTSRSGPNQP